MNACKSVLILGLSWFATVREDEPDEFRITTFRDDDRVSVKSTKGHAEFEVRSPRGISRATIRRTADRWPEKILFRLRLNGLENFKIETDALTIAGAVSSSDGEIRQWIVAKEEVQLHPKHRYWSEIGILDRDEQRTRTLPLKDGCFEIRLPKSLLESNPESLTLHWIDFYRN